MPDFSNLTAAQLEALLAHARVRNFKATFDVEVALDGTTVPVEVTMPEGELKQEAGREVLEQYIPSFEVSLVPPGKFVLHLRLYPVPSFDRDKQAVIRVVPREEAAG